MLCQNCKKKPTCIKLCERAEKWVNQDYRYQRELCVPEKTLEILEQIRIDKGIHDWKQVASYFSAQKINFPFLTSLQNKILHKFFFEGLQDKQIAFRLSGNRKGSYSCGAIRKQRSRAYAKIRHFFAIIKEGKK